MEHEHERDDDVARCPECDGESLSMGFLGILQWFRCRACGWEFSAQAQGTGERYDAE